VLLPAPRENKDNHGGEDEGRTATYCAGDDSYAASAFAVGITVNAAGAISADATRAVLLAKRFQLVRAISSVHATVADNVARHAQRRRCGAAKRELRRARQAPAV